MGRRFQRPWQIGVLLFLASCGLYGATASWGPLPGLPTLRLMQHLKLEILLPTLSSFWGLVVRTVISLPGLRVSAWMTLFSLVCAVLTLVLFVRLMVRTGYMPSDDAVEASHIREEQARHLSGFTAGLFLMLSLPFWIAATRTLPESFDLLWLMVSANLFSAYQQRGRRRYLFLFMLVFGGGMAESATFMLFLPLAVFLVLRVQYMCRKLLDWRSHLAGWAGFLSGASLVVAVAYLLWRRSSLLGTYDSWEAALLQILKDQVQEIFSVRYSAGFLVTVFLSAAPWLTLFVLSRRSPWYYEPGQILVRVVFLAGLLAVLFNVPFAPWALSGMGQFQVMPYVLMAVSAGYMTGELWILGELHGMLDVSRLRRLRRHLFSVLAWLVPAVVVVAGVHNWPAADARPGALLNEIAHEILEELDGPYIVISSGILDDTLRMAAVERHAPVVPVSAPRTFSLLYLRELAKQFQHETLSRPLRRGDFMQFIENLMHSESGPDQTVVIDYPDLFREYGHILPSGFFYRIRREAPGTNELASISQRHRRLWQHILVRGAIPAESNPARAYIEAVHLMLSRVANNLAVMQADAGDYVHAMETLRDAHRLNPENNSVLLNLLGVAQKLRAVDLDYWEERWAERLSEMRGERWGMGGQYGHLWDARQWLERGWVWALSGMPAEEEGASRRSADDQTRDAAEEARWDRLFHCQLQPARSPQPLYGELRKNPRQVSALLGLAQLAIREADFAAAEAYLVEAGNAGAAPDGTLFEEAMLRLARGETGDAVERLDALRHRTPGDARVWSALALLTPDDDPRRQEAFWVIRNQHNKSPEAAMVLAHIFAEKRDWKTVRRELERALAVNPRATAAWEQMADVAAALRNRKLAEASERALTLNDPTHYIGFQNRGMRHYQRGDFAAAEEAFRDGIRLRRDPTLLNNLAHLILQRGGHSEEALYLADEAIRRRPSIASLYNTRAQALIRMGQLDDARRDVLEALRLGGSHLDMLFELAEAYAGFGDRTSADELLQVGSGSGRALTLDQEERHERLLRAIRP